MRCRSWALLMVMLIAHAVSARAADAPAGPMASLFDTGKTSATSRPAAELSARAGWTAVPEDKLDHAFGGDAIFMNDRLAVVLRPGAEAAEIYSRHGTDYQWRANVSPGGGSLSGIQIVENSSAAVLLEARFATGREARCALRLRLTAGEMLLEIRGADGAAKVRVVDGSQYVVVPDFFADDMVYAPADVAGARLGLPTDNALLGMADDGRAIVACVWKSSRQGAELLVSSEKEGRAIRGYEIDLAKGQSLWMAVLEGNGIWHRRAIRPVEANAQLALDWKPPFAARWRADMVGKDGSGVSRAFDEALGTVHVEPDARQIVVYPIDRSRTTPLTAFCLVDVMRNALGVGPCQYVLDAEGLGGADSATPEATTHWVEKQLEKPKSRRDLDAIREQLAAMGRQVELSQQRIVSYRELGRRIAQLCGERRGFDKVRALAENMQSAQPASQPAASIAARLKESAVKLAALADRDGIPGEARELCELVRAAGAMQDYEMATLRMSVRRLRLECRAIAASDPDAAAIAKSVQAQIEQLQKTK